MIKISHKGDFTKTTRFLKNAKMFDPHKVLDRYGRAGVAALSAATPTDTGLTASSWSYEIRVSAGSYEIRFNNSNIQNGVPIAIILQYGHGTGTGGWVEGRDYINPAIQPIFDQIADEAWREVTKR